MTKFIPLQDRVLIQREDNSNQDVRTAGGIIIPEVAKEKLPTAVVLAVGPGRRDDKGSLIPMSVQVGDIVALSAYAGTEFKLDGEKVLTVRDDEILGKVIR